MRILLMHQTVAKHDAIGNDLWHMAQLLAKMGPVSVYCDFQKAEGYHYVNLKEAMEILESPENIVIYHHSGYWEKGGQMLLKAAEKRQMAHLIIRYHNVTPPEFFADYSAFYYRSCREGRQQTDDLMKNFPEAWWLCASRYNASELLDVLEERKKVIHPFHNLELWERIQPDKALLTELRGRKEVKVLFTGRVAPNKGHFSLLSMLEDFRENYGEPLALYMIGKFDGSIRFYTEELKRRILAAGLEKAVHFIGEVTDETLLAYYLGCDYYVSFSEHEGFGVPLIEAQKLGLPVIAKNAAAAHEVLGENQLLFGDNISHYSAAIAYLETHPEVRCELIQAGKENCERRFDNQKAGEELMDWIEHAVLAS